MTELSRRRWMRRQAYRALWASAGASFFLVKHLIDHPPFIKTVETPHLVRPIDGSWMYRDSMPPGGRRFYRMTYQEKASGRVKREIRATDRFSMPRGY